MNLVKEIIIFTLGGVFQSLMALLINENETKIDNTIICILLVIIVILTTIFLNLKSFNHYKIEWIRFLRKERSRIVIGIINDIKWEENDSRFRAHSGISPQEWSERLAIAFKKIEPNKFEIKLFNLENTTILDNYDVVINPYGGTYPEADTIKLVSYFKIKNYVSNGGIYINTADIPFYWSYDKNFGKVGDVKESYGNQLYVANKYFVINSKTDQLNLRFTDQDLDFVDTKKPIYNEAYKNYFLNKELNLNLHRLVQVRSGIIPIISMKDKDIHNNHLTLSPLFYFKYNKGIYFINLFSTHEKFNLALKEVLSNELVPDFIYNMAQSRKKKSTISRIY